MFGAVVHGVHHLPLIGERALGDDVQGMMSCGCIFEASAMKSCVGVIVGVEMRVCSGLGSGL